MFIHLESEVTKDKLSTKRKGNVKKQNQHARPKNQPH